MALTVTISPEDSYLVKNRMITRIQTSRYVTAAGSKAKVILSFTSTAAAVGQSLVFVTPSGISVTMIFALALDDSGTKLRTNTTSLSLTAFIAQVVEDLKGNYYLTTNYKITAGAGTITLEAKVIGADFTTAAFSSATGIAVLSMLAGTDKTTAPNHRIRVDVLAEDTYGANIYKSIASLEEEPFPGYAEFDLSHVLRYTFDQSDLPDYLETNIIRCKYAYKRYKLVYTEKYGSPAVMKQATEIGPYFAFNSGVSTEEFPLEPRVLDHIWTNARFLTWQEREKNGYVDSQDYLYFAVPSTASQFRMKVVAYYSDGTNSTAYPFTRTSINPYEIFRLPTGYANLVEIGSIFTVGKTVKYYDVYVDDNGSTPAILAGAMRYYMQYRELYEKQLFIFNNSLPAMETLETTGELVTGIQVDAYVGDRAAEFTESLVSDEMFKSYTEKLAPFRISTGWHSKERIDQVIDELFLANHVFIADKSLETWLPVIINKTTVEKFKSVQDLYAVNFEYTYAFRNKSTRGDITTGTTSTVLVSLPSSTERLVIDTGDSLTVHTE